MGFLGRLRRRNVAFLVMEKRFEGQWPFSVDRGILTCTKDGAVLFTTHRRIYALNGIAVRQAAAKGWFTDLDKIRRKDPKWGNWLPIGPVIELGLKRAGCS